MRNGKTRVALLKLGGIAAVLALFVAGRWIGGGSATAATPSAAQKRPAAIASTARPVTLGFEGELTQGGWISGIAPIGTTRLMIGDQAVEIAEDGRWFAAFDRDASPSRTLTAVLANGRVLTRQLTVSPRLWQIEHINIPRTAGGPSAAFMALRRPELQRIDAARAIHTNAQGWRQHFIWPLKGRISGRFGSQRIYRGEPGSYHSGIDITTGKSGTPFVSPADGVVILAAQAPFTLEGNLLMIDHGMGLNSAFLHCSAILVKEGDHVKQGQVVGRIGMTGRASGPHLHWSIKWMSARLDPLLFAGPMD